MQIIRKKYFLFVIILLGILLRIFYLNHHDIWFDEAFSYFIAKPSLNNILIATGADNNPPFYYIFLHFWMLFFGPTELSIRSLSLIVGVVSIPIIYLLTKRLFNKYRAIYATCFFALSPLMIYFSAEARMYSLFVFLTLLASLFFIKVIAKPKPLYQIFFFLFFALTLYIHSYGVLLFLPFSLIALRQKNSTRNTIFLLLVYAFIIFTPWMYIYFSYPHPTVFATSSVVSLPATFASFVVGGTGIVTMRTYFGSLSPIWVRLLFAGTTIVFMWISLAGLRHVRQNKNLHIVLVFILIPIVFLASVNFFIPVFSVRSTIFIAPFFFMVLAYGLDSIRNKNLIFILLITLLVVTNLIVLIHPLYRGTKMKSAATALSLKDKIMHMSVLTYYPYRYYQDDFGDNRLLTKSPLSQGTTRIIGEVNSDIPGDLKKFVVVDIKNGADEKEVRKKFQEMMKIYRLKKTVVENDLKLYYFEL